MASKVTISELVHKLVLDSTDLDAPLLASRKEVALYKKSMRELKTPLEQYEKDLKDAEGLLKFATNGQELYNRAIAKAEKRYKKLTGATAAEEKAQERLNKDRKSAADIIARQTTRLQRLERELHDVNRLHRQGHLSVRQHRIEMDRLNREFAQARRESSFFSQAGQRFGNFFGLDQLFGSAGSKVAGQLALLEIGIQLAQTYVRTIQSAAEFGINRFNTDREQIDNLAKSSRAIGIELDRLTGLQFAIGQTSGLSDEQTTKGIRELTKRSSEAAQGLGESQLAFKELNLEVQELNELSPDERLLKIANAIQDIENRSDRFRIAGKLFGEEQAEIVTTLEKGAVAIEKMIDRSEDLGFALNEVDAKKIEDVNDQIDSFERSLAAFSRFLTIEAADEMEELFEVATDLVNVFLENKDVISFIFDEGFLNHLETATFILKAVNSELQQVGRTIEDLKSIDLHEFKFFGIDINGGLAALKFISEENEKLNKGKNLQAISRPVDPAASIAPGTRDAFNIQFRTEITNQLDIAKEQLKVAKEAAAGQANAVVVLREISDKMQMESI